MQFTYIIGSTCMLKTFLQERQYSKNTISAIKHNGALIVNGQPETVRKQLEIGDILNVQLGQETASSNLHPFNQPLNILYEDDYLLIVSKEANQNCAPSRDHKHLRSQGLIDAPIGRDPSSIIQRRVDIAGKQAKTKYKCLQYENHSSLCEVTLLTGRTHQIRVHLQHIGHPIVGDDLYGGTHPIYKHQLLRCSKVSFIHPIYNETIEIQDKYDAIENIFKMI